MLQLQLVAVLLDEGAIFETIPANLAMIVADEAAAIRLSASFFKEQTEHRVAILGIRPAAPTGTNPPEVSDTSASADRDDTPVAPAGPHPGSLLDGILLLPESPERIALQLGAVLDAHRASARRFDATLEELAMNRRIFQSISSGITVADATLPDLPLTYANPAFEAMTGYSFGEIQGRNCRFLQGSERDQPGIIAIREAIATGGKSVTVVKNFRKDGTAFWNELSLSPICNRDGRVTHFVGIQNDVTARVEFEEALRESEKLAAVGRLAASIAHEINNPLESVMNLVYLAQRAENPDEVTQYLDTADKELQRVKLIASRSLRFYKQSTRAQPVSCTELIGSVLDVHQSRLHTHGVTVERRDRCDCSIVCMDSEIRQVLNNLVSNAIDALHGAPGRLLVRSREATEWSSGARGVVISIADTGTGISPDTMKNVYKAFYTTKGIGGTGLGLWISSEIVERHHGRLLVRSTQRPGKTGTVFQLFLPNQSPLAV